MRFLSILILFGVYLVIFPGLTFAQTDVLSVSPPITALSLDPGKTISTPLTIANPTDQSLSIRIILKQLSLSETGALSYPSLSTSGMTSDASLSFVKVLNNSQPITTLVLAPQQQKQLQVRISLPKKHSLADSYFSVIFVTNQQIGEAPSGTSITALSQINLAVASHILIQVNDQKPAQLLLDSFSTYAFHDSGNIPFSVKLTNPSNHFLPISGTINIWNMFGQHIGQLTLPNTYLLSHTSRFIGQMTPENSHPTIAWNNTFAIGMYHATLTLTNTTTNQPLETTIEFVVFPWKTVGVALLIIGGLIIVGSKVRKRLQ